MGDWSEKINADLANDDSLPAVDVPIVANADSGLRERALRAEERAARAELVAKVLERELFIRGIDPEGKLARFDTEIQALKTQFEAAKRACRGTDK